jgi:hypothetical protein
LALMLVLKGPGQCHFAIGRDNGDARRRSNPTGRQSLRHLLNDLWIGDPVVAFPHDVTHFLVGIGGSHCFALPATGRARIGPHLDVMTSPVGQKKPT